MPCNTHWHGRMPPESQRIKVLTKGINGYKRISKCDVFLSHLSLPQRETIQQYEIIARPWAKVGVGLCHLHGRTLLIVCDYFSGFIEVERLQSTTTAPVIKELMVLFARYMVPTIAISDNGPQFSSGQFRSFARTWRFQHITSSL